MVLTLEALLEHLKLKHAHHADDDALHASAELAEDLDGTLLGKLLHALHKLLALEGVHLGDLGKVLRGKGRDRRELHVLLARAHGVSDGEDTRVKEAHDVSGVCLIDDGAVIGHHGRARGELELATALHVVGIHAALELAGADAHEGDAVAVVLVHVGLDLEDKAREIVARGLHRLTGELVGVGARRGGKAQELLEEGLHAKVGERRAKERRRELAAGDRIQVKLVSGTIQELDVVHQVAVVLLANELVHGGVAQLGLNLRDLLSGVGAAVALEGNDASGLAVKDSAEVAAGANGPVHGIRPDAQDVLDLLHELEGVSRVVVELVDEGEDGDVPECADLEELLGLGLDALCAVDDHDRGVGGHEGPVGVLREVLVPGGVEDVHAAAVIGELQYRGGDGDAALLLDVHPVRDRVLGAALALYGASGLDAAGIQEELLGEGGLACVRVRDDRERAARRDLVREVRHAVPLSCGVNRTALPNVL